MSIRNELTHPAQNEAVLRAGLANHKDGLWALTFLLQWSEIGQRQQGFLAYYIRRLQHRILTKEASITRVGGAGKYDVTLCLYIKAW